MAYSQAHRLPLPADASSSSSQNRIEPAELAFIADPAKLGDQAFEAYKLVQDDPSGSSGARSYGLPSRPPRLVDVYAPHDARRDGRLTFTGLGYKETKQRALHQLLVPSAAPSSPDEPFAAYIDTNSFVVVLTYDSAKDRVVGHPVHRLLLPNHAGSTAAPAASLPSLASLSATAWLVSSGTILTQLTLRKVALGDSRVGRWTCAAESTWEIPSSDDGESGVAIKACKKIGGRTRVLVQSTKVTAAAGARAGMQGLGFERGGEHPTETVKERQSAHSQTAFEVRLLELDDAADAAASTETQDEASIDTAKTARLLWTVRGEEPLLMARLDEQHTLLGSEAPFLSIKAESAATPAGVHAQSNASTASIAPQPTAASRGSRPAPHFSWAQTSDTLTIAFALPSWIAKPHIRAHFSLGALSLSFTHEALALLKTPTSSARITEINADAGADAANDAEQSVDDLTNAARMIASGRYVSRSTWAEIDPTGSVWTLERARGASLLTLHLEKRHEGTRWMQVFADRTADRANHRNRNYMDAENGDRGRTQLSFQQARSDFERIATGKAVNPEDDQKAEDEEEDEDDAEDHEDDVPETMDPSELISMLEGMQKYTVDEEEAQQGNGHGLDRTGFQSSSGHGQNGGTSLSLDQPSLLKDSLEEEDANVGRDFVVSSVSHAGGDKVDIRTSENGETTVLATSLPSGNGLEEAVVVKHDLDGTVFVSSARDWQHVATMPALAFVLASKRDAQRVHVHQRYGRGGHEAGYVVLAFESAPQVTGSGERGSTTTATGAGNLFLYYSPSSSSAKHAQSRVVRLGATGSSTALEDGIVGDGGETEEMEAAVASGALLGVCSVRLPRAGAPQDASEEEKEETLVCLCENRLLLLRGLL